VLMSSWGVTASRIRLALLGMSIALAATACGSSAVGAAQHAGHVIDARVVAGCPGGPVAAVFVGDLL